MEIEQIEQIKETLIPLLTQYGLRLLGAALVLIAGWIISKWASNRLQQWLEKTDRIDKTIQPIFVKSVKVLILTLTVLIVLGQFGVETASIIALLGTIGLAIGLALQGTLSNIASGVMLLVLRPFNVGDVVDIGGTLGIVDEIGLFVTELHTFDNIAITIANTRIWGNIIQNYTKHDIRRVDLEFGIHYKDDISEAMRIINEVLDNDERVLEEPERTVAVGTLADSSVNIRVRPWTETENLWPLRYDLLKGIKERFQEEGITIPFPQRDLHIMKNEE